MSNPEEFDINHIEIEEFDLLDFIEDEIDAQEIELALDELRQGKTIPWEQVKKELNL